MPTLCWMSQASPPSYARDTLNTMAKTSVRQARDVLYTTNIDAVLLGPTTTPEVGEFEQAFKDLGG